ncbi:lysozyme inhibitor LprI family protein [Acinetobacter pittii]|uniref:lysozyme inhibitor LprI family protein n=1 Tax=Acinetobacter pittii TaxID=48296 RepID=UPI002813E16B|nr:lysozyme inhibitor LprI family protein [Acinetobacter pittii]MDQ9888030.1 lysozyme inhibitor LprI family protein [Acinetobacter pittii]
MRTSFIKFYNFLLVSSVCISSNATDYKPQRLDEKTIYSNSEHDLNSMYSDIKSYISDNKNEVKYLVDTQRSWLKDRNLQCKFNGKEASSENYKCLSDFNNSKIKDLKKSYLDLDSLEVNLIKPFKYTKGIVKELEIGGCYCSESTIKILKNKIYIYQACDQGLKEPRIYNIVSKKKDGFSVEYQIDTNNNKVPEFNLAFVTNGKKVWNMVPKIFRKEDLINLNFAIHYTTDVNVKNKKNDCHDDEE